MVSIVGFALAICLPMIITMTMVAIAFCFFLFCFFHEFIRNIIFRHKYFCFVFDSCIFGRGALLGS